RARVARDHRPLPLVPSCTVAHIFHRAKERVVVKPRGRLLTEGVKLAAQRWLARLFEVFEGAPEQFVFVFDDGAVLDALGRELRRFAYVLLTEQALFDQFVGTDEQSVTGEGREALIRRIAVAGRPQRQHLPERLPRPDEKIYEGVGFWAEVADAIATGQRCRVQQNTARAREAHRRTP